MNAIELTRGDTAHFEIEIVDQNGDLYELQPEDQLMFTVKKSVYDKNIVLQKRIEKKQFTITHEDSAGLAYGSYVYDIQLTQANGDVTTIVKPSDFKVTEEVNFD